MQLITERLVKTFQDIHLAISQEVDKMQVPITDKKQRMEKVEKRKQVGKVGRQGISEGKQKEKEDMLIERPKIEDDQQTDKQKDKNIPQLLQVMKKPKNFKKQSMKLITIDPKDKQQMLNQTYQNNKSTEQSTSKNQKQQQRQLQQIQQQDQDNSNIYKISPIQQQLQKKSSQKRQKSKIQKPKKPQSAVRNFINFAKNQPQLLPQLDKQMYGVLAEVTKAATKKWQSLSEEEKRPWVEAQEKDNAEYKKKMKEYYLENPQQLDKQKEKKKQKQQKKRQKLKQKNKDPQDKQQQPKPQTNQKPQKKPKKQKQISSSSTPQKLSLPLQPQQPQIGQQSDQAIQMQQILKIAKNNNYPSQFSSAINHKIYQGRIQEELADGNGDGDGEMGQQGHLGDIGKFMNVGGRREDRDGIGYVAGNQLEESDSLGGLGF